MQIPGSVGCVVGGISTFCGVTTNAGKARIQGVEFEGNARVVGNPGGPRLNFGWSLGYLDAKFKEFIDARGIDVPLLGPGPNGAQRTLRRSIPERRSSCMRDLKRV